MDTFKILTGLIGLILFITSIYFLIVSLIKVVKKKEAFKNLITSFILFFIFLLISTIFILLFTVLQTFIRFSYEEKIGEVFATKNNNEIKYYIY